MNSRLNIQIVPGERADVMLLKVICRLPLSTVESSKKPTVFTGKLPSFSPERRPRKVTRKLVNIKLFLQNCLEITQWSGPGAPFDVIEHGCNNIKLGNILSGHYHILSIEL